MSWSIPPDFLHWASWLESLTQIFVQCPGPWNVSRVEWKPSGLQVPLTNKWSNDQVTTWPSDPMRKKGRWQIWFWSKISSRALSSQWHLATLTHLEEPLSTRATPMSSSTLSGAANDKEYPINWPADLREGRSPDVIYFWQVLFLGTSFNKFNFKFDWFTFELSQLEELWADINFLRVRVAADLRREQAPSSPSRCPTPAL